MRKTLGAFALGLLFVLTPAAADVVQVIPAISGGGGGSSFIPRGYIFGLTLSNNGTDATNDIDIAAGEAASDDVTPVALTLASSITKRLDAAWAVGSGNGGLDTGSASNTTYHMWLIRRSDTGVVDVLFSTSASSPTMPANYDQKRRIGSIMRVSSAIVAFTQLGDEFLRKTGVLDVNLTTTGTSAVTRTLSVPTGVQVWAKIAAQVGGSGNVLFLSALDENDQAASATGAFTVKANSVSGEIAAPVLIRTNTSAQIRSRMAQGSGGDPLRIFTQGWIDRRGQDN